MIRVNLSISEIEAVLQVIETGSTAQVRDLPALRRVVTRLKDALYYDKLKFEARESGE